MPHAIIEYSKALEGQLLKAAFMDDVHANLLSTGEFGEKDIKVRLRPVEHALVAGTSGNFIHITLYLLSGRSKEVKSQITGGLLNRLELLDLPVQSLSVDARDIDRAVYSKVAYPKA